MVKTIFHDKSRNMAEIYIWAKLFTKSLMPVFTFLVTSIDHHINISSIESDQLDVILCCVLLSIFRRSTYRYEINFKGTGE